MRRRPLGIVMWESFQPSQGSIFATGFPVQ
jgi:hypothetical protein